MIYANSNHRRRWACLLVLLGSMLLCASAAAPANALELESLDVVVVDDEGNAETQAASHPHQVTVDFRFETVPDPEFGSPLPIGSAKDVRAELPPGLVGDPSAVGRCTIEELLPANGEECPPGAQVGFAKIRFPAGYMYPAIYSMVPDADEPARFGMNVSDVGVFLVPEVRTGGDYGLTMSSLDTSQVYQISEISTTFWGVPADSRHDGLRGDCLALFGGPTGDLCASPESKRPFLTLPSDCQAPSLPTTVSVNSWHDPTTYTTMTDADDVDGNPFRMSGCGEVPFAADFALAPTTSRADSPTGALAELSIPQPEAFDGLAASHLKKAVISLPAGLSVNPAAAQGLGSCAAGGIALDTPAAASCPTSSKIGTVEVRTPLLDQPLGGSVYLAQQGQNPFGSLLALYLVAEGSGVRVKLPGLIATDPASGRLTATFDDNPQLPFSELRVRFFGGDRAVLVTPPTCGTYAVEAGLHPWARPNAPVRAQSSFEIDRGPDGGPCPVPNQFDPQFSAGTLTPIAGAYSPLLVHASRPDGSQVLRGIEAVLPPGLLARLAGTPYCSAGALADAATKSGAVELALPSCPAASQVATVDVGVGAGGSPFHVTGRAYLTGPHGGAPLGLAVVTPAVAGPLDLGTVVVRAALRVDPLTAQVRAVSDPIPSILQGIPLHVRSVSISADRPGFTLNPTSCDAMSLDGFLLGSTVGRQVSNRFQVGACAALGFEPRLLLRLRGGTRRAAYPALTAVLTAKPGQANVKRVSVALPPSELLAQEHIRTVCTRVQFAADACPAGSVYGFARAMTPLLDQPLEGPVYLRSSSNPLPDLVAALRGQIAIDLVGRIDSVNGGIRTTFAATPDAPISKFVLRMKGGKRGLLSNSRNLCTSSNRAKVAMSAHSGKTASQTPLLRASCEKGANGKGGGG